MKKMSIHIYISIAVFLSIFIIGSFVDLNYAKMIFSPNNQFGITSSVISIIVGYGLLAFFGGVVIYHAFKFTEIIWQRILLIIFSIGLFAVGTYFSGDEPFGPNGWYNPSLKWLGYLIYGVIMIAIYYLGYLFAKKANNPRAIIVVIIFSIFTVVALLIGTVLLKSIFSRPRYRIAVHDGYVNFHNWWEPCKDAKTYIEEYGLNKDEFKSFPSGHTSVSALSMMFVVALPSLLNKEIKHQVIYFYIALVFTLFVAFIRTLVGAHYLSDVGMGGLITSICTLGFYFINNHFNKSKNEEIKS